MTELATSIQPPTIASELAADIYQLTEYARPGTRWYDAGFHTGEVTRRLISLGAHPIGAADTDPIARDFIRTVDPCPVIHERFDPIAMIADCHHLHGAKIDVQGGEVTLLNLTPPIWRRMPPVITMEWHDQHIGPHAEIIATLRDHGYTVTQRRPWADSLDGSTTTIITAHRPAVI